MAQGYTAAATAYQQLCDLLVSRNLQPGDRVPSIRQLASQFGVGIVAMRDALVQTQREGIVEIRPRSGAFVLAVPEAPRRIDLHDAPVRVVDGHQLHLCHTRKLLEVHTAGEAALRCRPEDLLPVREALETWLHTRAIGVHRETVEADCRFHLGIARMAGNPVVVDLLSQCLRRQYMLECTLPERRADAKRVVAIHREIYEALRDRDAPRAQHAMQRHMEHLEDNIHRILATVPAEPVDHGTSAPRAMRGVLA
ncbi:MAG TPA: FCD domain-containing protein [Pirellulales bacterium]|nr:FCD domain-containing protein [Pirellulales bacterium]